jgi:lysophospholipase L1-like esterase
MKLSKKKILIASLIFNFLLVSLGLFLAGRAYYWNAVKPTYRDYYQNKISLFRTFGKTNAAIVFVGDSLTDRCDWGELLGRCDVVNRGIDADTTGGVLERISDITHMKPAKIFIMIGGNDFIFGKSVTGILENYRKIIARVRAESPGTVIYVQSVLPTVYRIVPILRSSIKDLNEGLRSLADGRMVIYIDVYSQMVDIRGDLNPTLTLDGAHLNGPGYLVWKKAILPYIR